MSEEAAKILAQTVPVRAPAQGPKSWLATPVGMFLGRLAIVCVILVAWQLASGRLIPAVWVSTPTKVAVAFVQSLGNGTLLGHLQITLETFILGYVSGAAAGIILGFILGLMPRVEQVVSPFISGIWCLPKIALLPLYVIFLGIGMESRVTLVATVVVFLLLYNTISGVRDVDPDLVDSLKLMGATPWEILTRVLFPSALPWVYTGLRVSVTHALSTTVVGELLSSNRGLGFLIESSSAQYDAADVFAAVIVLVVLSVLVTEMLGRIEARSLRWRGA